MRRLVFVNRFFFPDISATSQMLSDLAFGIAGATTSYEVHVLCSRQLYEDPTHLLPASQLILGVQIHRVRTTRYGRTSLPGRAIDYLSFHAAAAWQLFKLVRRDDVVIAKTDPPLISLVCAAIAKLRGARLINWLQDVFPEVADRLQVAPVPAPLLRILLALRDWTLRRADRNVVIGAVMQRHLQNRAIPATRCRIIENWAELPSEPLSPADSHLRQQLALQDSFVVQYSGNLGRAHDIDTVLQAASLLRDCPGLTFLFIGGGARLTELKHAVAEQQLDHLFRFLSYQPRDALADSLAAGDVHLVSLDPALEGLIVPSKIYGIFAAGRPTLFVGSPRGEIAEKLSRAGAGLTVQPGAGAALADAIMDLRTNAESRLAMGLRAHELYLQHHTAPKAIAQWLQVIDAVFDERAEQHVDLAAVGVDEQ
jgi:glycosyltransferase involved in cell wall biosynthesis